MQSFGHFIALLVLGALSACQLSCAQPASSLIQKTFKNSEAQWQELRESLEQQRENTCSYLMSESKNSGKDMTLDEVTGLFESSLDHIARTNEIFGKLLPFVEADKVDAFDLKGQTFILELSQARSRLIEDYRQAESMRADAEVLRRIVEEAFYKACTYKLGTIVMEKSMYESAQKFERLRSSKAAPAASG